MPLDPASPGRPSPGPTERRSPSVTLVERDGAIVVRKEHRSVADARAEAAWLAAAPVGGVVRLLAHDATTTITEHVAGPTLRTARLDEDDAALVFLSLARTLADIGDRDLVHGAVNPDHVIVSGHDAVLCSPDAGATAIEVDADARGLALCLGTVIGRWEADALQPSPTWSRLQTLLGSDAPPPPRRVARAIAPLAQRTSPPTAVSPKPAHRPVTSVALLAAFLVAVFAGLWLLRPEPAIDPGLVISIDDERFGVGPTADAAVGVDQRCQGHPAAAVLDGDDTVWIFDQPSDGAAPTRAVQVPGAMALEVEPSVATSCPSIVVTGPAGRTELTGDDP